MNYLLMLVSISLEAAKNAFPNQCSKNTVKNAADIYKFNLFLYVGAFAALLFLGDYGASTFTVICAVVFAAVTVGSQHFVMKAYACGPMALTTFIQCSNLIIPALYGVLFLKEELTLLRIVALAALMAAMAMVLNLKCEGLNGRWLLFALLSMLCTGGIGVMQTVHQCSEQKGELIAFLRISFGLALLINLVLWRLSERKEKAGYRGLSKVTLSAVVSGVSIAAVNIINLYLSGVVEKLIFFPIINGGLIFMSVAVAVVVFKERITLKQWAGLLTGVLAICMLG